jgi:hypothetical protein
VRIRSTSWSKLARLNDHLSNEAVELGAPVLVGLHVEIETDNRQIHGFERGEPVELIPQRCFERTGGLRHMRRCRKPRACLTVIGRRRERPVRRARTAVRRVERRGPA